MIDFFQEALGAPKAKRVTLKGSVGANIELETQFRVTGALPFYGENEPSFEIEKIIDSFLKGESC